MKRTILLLGAIALCNSLYSQIIPTFKGPVVYGELAGAGSLLTVNVEHVVWKISRWYVNARVGYGYMMINGYERSGIPVGINLFKFVGNHHVELSGGLSYIEGIERYYSSGPRWNRGLYAYGAVGYRYQRPQGGMFFRAQWHPLFQLREYNPDPWFQIGAASPYWWGLSVGYAISTEKKIP